MITRVTNERAAVKMVTDHGVIISYQFTLAIGPTHSSLNSGGPPQPWTMASAFFLTVNILKTLSLTMTRGAVNLLIRPR